MVKGLGMGETGVRGCRSLGKADGDARPFCPTDNSVRKSNVTRPPPRAPPPLIRALMRTPGPHCPPPTPPRPARRQCATPLGTVMRPPPRAALPGLSCAINALLRPSRPWWLRSCAALTRIKLAGEGAGRRIAAAREGAVNRRILAVGEGALRRVIKAVGEEAVRRPSQPPWRRSCAALITKIIIVGVGSGQDTG